MFFAGGYTPNTMVSQERIQEVVDSIAEQFHPDKIILFGSYAYGTPSEDSDVDLLVVLEQSEHNLKKALEISRAVQIRFPCDLLVYDPQYLQKRYGMVDWFVRDIVDKGQVLYESSHAGMGDKGRKRLAQPQS